MHKSLLAAMTIAAAIFASSALLHAQPYGPGMMGGWEGGYGDRGWMMGGGGYGPGWMRGWRGGGYGMGPGMMYGWASGNEGNLNLTTDEVRIYLRRIIHNPNLTVGDVKEKDADIIVAEIITKQGSSLVQKLEFNRHNGFIQPEQ